MDVPRYVHYEILQQNVKFDVSIVDSLFHAHPIKKRNEKQDENMVRLIITICWSL